MFVQPCFSSFCALIGQNWHPRAQTGCQRPKRQIWRGGFERLKMAEKKKLAPQVPKWFQTPRMVLKGPKIFQKTQKGLQGQKAFKRSNLFQKQFGLFWKPFWPFGSHFGTLAFPGFLCLLEASLAFWKPFQLFELF